MMRNMVTAFIDQEHIETTDAKAKELRPLAERLVTLAKRGGDDLAARRRALKVIRDKKIVSKLFNEIGPRYADRPGGYTRIVKVETRRGDGAPLSVLKFVTEPVTFKEKKHKLEEELDQVGPAVAAAAAAEGASPEESEDEAIETKAGESAEVASDDAEPAAESEGQGKEDAPEEEKPKEG